MSLTKRPGTTLTELLVAITIIGTLVGLMLPGVQAVRRAAEYTEHLSWLRQRRLDDPPPRKTMRVVFIGNSRTYWNDIPGIIVELGRSAGIHISIKVIVEGGQTLEGLWEHGEAQAAITDTCPTFVVLQEQGERVTQPDAFHLYEDYASRFIQLCKTDAVPLIYATWGYAGDRRDIQSRITGNAFVIAKKEKNTHTEVCVVGEAWQRCRDERPDVNLFDDDRHPNQYGAYLAACVFHATLHRLSPEGLPSTLTTQSGVYEGAGQSITVDETTAHYLQKVAWETAQRWREKNKPYYLQRK